MGPVQKIQSTSAFPELNAAARHDQTGNYVPLYAAMAAAAERAG